MDLLEVLVRIYRWILCGSYAIALSSYNATSNAVPTRIYKWFLCGSTDGSYADLQVVLMRFCRWFLCGTGSTCGGCSTYKFLAWKLFRNFFDLEGVQKKFDLKNV